MSNLIEDAVAFGATQIRTGVREDPRDGAWQEHPLALGSLEGDQPDHTPQILVLDVNGDGLNDILTSSAHKYGIFWYQQIRKGGAISFKEHLIDDSWSQPRSSRHWAS